MSGLINSAGSKSGVIGTTEIEGYEEGTWAPTSAGFDVVGSFTSGGYYKKFGKMVFVTGWVRGSTSIGTTGGAATIGGALPFTIVNGANKVCPYIVYNGGQSGWVGYAWYNNIYTIFGSCPNMTVGSDGIFFTLQYAID